MHGIVNTFVEMGFIIIYIGLDMISAPLHECDNIRSEYLQSKGQDVASQV